MPAPTLRALLLLCCCLWLWPAASAAPAGADFAVKIWETDDGLPHNQVAAVLQRRDGFLWVATLGGVARFDGVAFTRLDSPLVHGVKSSNTIGLIEENADALLISSNQSGLVRLQHGEATLHPLNAQLSPRARPLLLQREADDVFWVLTGERTLLRWAHGRVETFPPSARARGAAPPSFATDTHGGVFITRGAGVERFADGKLAPLPDVPEAALTIAPARAGGIWIATARELGLWRDGKLCPVATPPPWNTPQVPTALFEDHGGALWIGAVDQGLLRWKDGRTDSVATSHARITALCEDDEGNVWAATAGGGLDRVQPKRVSLIAAEPDWTDSLVASICEDAAGDMWFANRNEVRKLHPDGQVERISQAAGLPKSAAPIVADAHGDIWFAVTGGIYRAKAGGAEPPELVDKTTADTHAIWPARDGSVWFGCTGRTLARVRPDGRIEHFGPSTGYNGHNVRVIGGDAHDHVWVGTSEGRLYEWSGKKFHDRSDALGLSGYPIRAVHGDAEGRLWVGTVGAGVLLVAGVRLDAISLAQGLPDDVISQILEDDHGWLWFGSQRGIFKVRKSELVDCAAGRARTIAAVSFGRADGLSGVSAIGGYQPSAWKSRSGELWFVTRKGLVRANPAPPEIDPQSLRVYLEALVVDGRTVEATGGASPQMTSAARRLEFQFTAPTFTAPERTRFRYRLEGVDADWVDGGAERAATYSSLRPGPYRFTVNASGIDGAWTPAVATLTFDVLPMWWETWWARSAALAVTGLGLVWSARLWSHRRLQARLARLEQEQRVDRERVRIARDLHDDLGASLTHAGMLAEELAEDWRDLPDAPAHSARLAERVRAIARDLDAVVWTVSPKNDSLASLAAYLGHFAEEYFRPTPIACRVQTAEDIPATPLPPDARHHLFMIAKELFNNVLKHSHARNVAVTLRMAGGAFELVVADDGRGFSIAATAESARNGLKNLRARAAEVGGSLNLASTDAGTSGTLRFPGPAT